MFLERADTRGVLMPDEQEPSPLDLLRDKRTEISEQVPRLRSKAKRQRLIHNLLGYSTIAISLALGGSLGTTLLSDGGLLADSTFWRVIGAILGFVSAFLAAVQTRAHLAEHAQENLRLAADYVDVDRAVQRYLSSYSEDPNLVNDSPYVHLEWVDNSLSDFQRREAEIGA